LAEALRGPHKAQLEHLLASGKRNEHNAVFITSNGTLYSPRNVLRHFQLICQRHGLTVVDLHSLRHLHVSWLLESGLDFKTIQDRVGHSRIQTTMNIYAHLVDNSRAKAVDATEEKNR